MGCRHGTVFCLKECVFHFVSGEEAILNSDRTKALDEQFGGLLSDCAATGGFEGKKVCVPAMQSGPALHARVMGGIPCRKAGLL